MSEIRSDPAFSGAGECSERIQGLLLGLNFSLPHFLKAYNRWWQRTALLSLSAVALFCSFWFSYLFIAGNSCQGAWDTKCLLIAQKT